MANIDREITITSDETKEETGRVLFQKGSLAATVTDDSPGGPASNGLEGQGQDPQTLASVGDAAVSPSSTNITSASGVSSNASQPKRFSAVNINKKFLEKNSSAAGAAQTSSGSTSAKSGGTVSRPPVQPPPTHSRLVTTKLTTTPQSSGSGWSRPPSATPPVSSISSPGPTANNPVVATPASMSTAPQLPHAGKVIQPQSRTVASTSSKGLQKDGTGTSSKTAWGNIKAPMLVSNNSGPKEQNDFPTAAEVAQVSTSSKKAKTSDTKEVTDAATASYNQTRMEAADTFRGVHLDPNAHHWDEMSEDDDNFLDGVIEFGDGRQYTVQSVPIPQSSSPPLEESRPTHGDGFTTQPAVLVSKEERFADDFDRSWPRSKPSPASSQQDVSIPGHHVVPLSPAPSHSVSPTQETSRVLFNERSNKLEPYSNAHPPYRTNQGVFSMKRGNQSESTSATDIRNSRELPLHSQSQNLQVLQKPGQGHVNEFTSRPRGSSASFGTNTGNTFHNERSWGGESFRRETLPGPVSDSRRNNRDHYNPFSLPPSSPVRDRDNISEMRAPRSSTMGPPPLPAPPSRGHHKDSGRHLPPQMLPATQPVQGNLSVQEPQVITALTTVLSPGTSSPLLPSHSPLLSHVPLASPNSIAGFPGVDLDEARKDVMQTAAARAKERRRKEEEEREKEKERARKKAAELEAMMNEKQKPIQAEKAVLDKEVVDFIEDAVKGAERRQVDDNAANSAVRREPSYPQPIGTLARRPPSLKGLPRRLSQTSTSAPTSAPLPTQADSWRNKVTHPVSAAARPPPPPQPSSVFPEPTSVFQHDDVLTLGVEENLEVIDFMDLGKFVGDVDAAVIPAEKSTEAYGDPTSRPARPVASDFFQGPSEAFMKADLTWRKDLDRDQPQASEEDLSQSLELSRPTAASNHGQQRTPRSAAFHKEANLSAWDDAMSRIKGAMDGMQSMDQPKSQNLATDSDLQNSTTVPQLPSLAKSGPPKEPRWIPPALRVHYSLDTQSREEVVITGDESLNASHGLYAVRFPSRSRLLESPSRRQLHLSKIPVNVRWDVLSWDPPVEGMIRRDFSLNDVLFRKPTSKGKHKYRVSLPRSRLKTAKVTGIGPRVHLPANTPMVPKSNAPGYFGRVSEADGLSTWRKPISPALAKVEITDEVPTKAVLDTVSRSPPPELPHDPVNFASLPKSDVSLAARNEAVLVRTRSQPKMPAGSAVAFYRDSRIDTVDADRDTAVNFIVNSELEDPSPSSSHVTSSKSPSIVLSSPPSTGLLNGAESGKEVDLKAQDPLMTMVNGLRSQPASPECDIPALIQSNSESKSSDSTDRMPITPPSHHTNATWTTFGIKDSPSRAPDPEHLKAVWSQASDKAKLPAVNSLEGIGDDLTALPFILQDVKSEDGETPPPSVVPNRMSLHEVTRAFQQVPSSSSGSSIHKVPSLSPSSPSVPLAQRQPNYTYTLAPPANTDLRPGFHPYPSPMMSHSPSPAMPYSHPAPNSVSRLPANGHTSVYSQPVWFPLPGPSTQNPSGMIRPLASPYPTQIVPYPSSSTPAVYGPPGSMPASMATGASQNNTQARVRMPLMSPVIPHIGPHPNAALYAGSPVLMHTPVMQGHTYMPLPSGRRNDPPGHLPLQQPPSVHNPPHNVGYATVAPAPFGRPNW